MSEPQNWLIEIVRDASQKVAARPAYRRSHYWEERRRQMEAALKSAQEAEVAEKEPQR